MECVTAVSKTMSALTLLAPFAAGLAQEAELPPGPEPVYRAEFDPQEIPEDFGVVSLVLDFPAGAGTPLHSHPGPGIVLILEGELTGFDAEGSETVYRAGDTFLEGPAHRHRVQNRTDRTTRVLFTILLPAGEALTTVHD